MKALIRFFLGIADLYSARVVLADDGDIRVAASVVFTADGHAFVPPSAGKPVFYAPVVTGNEDKGAILVYYQRTPPPVARVSHQLAKALADRGFQLADPANPSAAPVVLDFQWGYIAFQPGSGVRTFVSPAYGHVPSLPGQGRMPRWSFWDDEMATYIIGENWRDYFGRTDPRITEIFNDIRGGRYYLLVSALDGPAYFQHKRVVLWRAHVSTEYWGHYLDEVLPTLIDTAALIAGRETVQPLLITVPLAGWQPVDKTGPAQLTEYRSVAPDRKS